MFTANRSAGMSDEDNYCPSEHSNGDDADKDYENLVILHAASLSDSDNSAAAMPPSIKTVWETKKFEKMVDKDAHKMWKGHFCGIQRSEWKHTKACHHTIGGKDVASCRRILPWWKVVFDRFAAQKNTKKTEQDTHERNLALSMVEKDVFAYAVYSKKKKAKLASRNHWKTATVIESIPTVDECSTVSSISPSNFRKRSAFEQYFELDSSKK